MTQEPENMTIAEIENEIESLKSPTEKLLDRDTRRWILEKEISRRLREESK